MSAVASEVDTRPEWLVSVVQLSSSGDRSVMQVTLHAETPVQAWCAAQELPGMPAESETCHYATPVRVRTEPAGAS